jgi:N-acetylmuramoyl-L-alanine amidase
MSTRTRVLILSVCVVLAVAGCQPPQHQPAPIATVKPRTISIDELAARLGLRVDERDAAFVILKNAANTVLIFTHADGRFFVNGKPIGPVGAVQKTGSTVYVPDALAAAIRPCLRAAGPERPPVATPPRPKTPIANAVVVVDAGHGGKDPGTMVGGAYEKNIDLQVARKVAALLAQQRISVTMTRDRDEFIELEERANIANRCDADLFVSIHSDSAPDHSISGFTVYVAGDASRDSYKAAQAVSAAMSRTESHTRGIREAEYKVLVQTRCPAILVELGYLSNFADSRHLQDSAFQTRLAQAIASGVLDYLQ